MRLYLESKDALEKLSDKVHSSVTLANLVEGKRLTSIERAGLTTAMKQIDKDHTTLAFECRNNPDLIDVLAVEALKENIAAAWTKFMSMVKNVIKRFLEGLDKVAQRVKRFFKRKAGDENKNFDRNDEGSAQEESGEATKEAFKLPKTYTMSKCYIDMGDQANTETFIERLKLSNNLVRTAEVLVAQHGGSAAAFFKAAENTTENDQWESFVGQRSQAVLDLLVDRLGVKVDKGVAKLEISSTASIVMLLTDLSSFPSLVLDKEETVDLELPNDPRQFGAQIRKLAEALLKPLLSAIDESRKILGEREYNNLSKVQDPKVRQRMMTLSSLVTRRSLFIKDIIAMVSITQDIADGISADIEQSTGE